MAIHVLDRSTHRNGVTGVPFEVVLFSDDVFPGKKFVAVRLRQRDVASPWEDATFVLEVGKVAAGDVSSDSNSWYGDAFARKLDQAGYKVTE